MEIKSAHGRAGQAIVEYVLLLAIIIGMAGAIMASVRSGRDKMWKSMICEVTAPCPGCRAPDSAKSLLPRSGVNCKN